MEDLLPKWDMPELIEQLKENEITLEDMTDLTENLIQELIPQIEKRMKFTKKLKEYKLEKETDITLPEYMESNHQTDIDISLVPVVFSTSSEVVSDGSWVSSNSETEPILIPQYNKDAAFCGIEDLLSRKNDMPEFDLKTLLLVGPYGSRPRHGKIVVCYLGTWAVYRPDRGSFAVENLEPSLCTHVIYSFAGLNPKEDAIKSLDPWQDLTENYGKGGYQRITSLKLRYPHLKVSLAIGGWNEGSANYSKLASEPPRRSKFVASAVDFIRKYNFDGLDLDWEFPGKRGGAPEDKLNFLLLVKELRAAFRKHNLLLTAAFGAGKDTIDLAYDVEGLGVYLDFIHMMCYDYHGAWDQKTGANAPLRSSDVLNVEYTLNYMIKLGAPTHKLVLGVPLYGRTFVLPEALESSSKKKPKLGMVSTSVGFQGPLTRESGFMGYNEICLELKNKTAPWKKYWDSESSTPFAMRGTQVITYDDERSIYEKVKFAMEKKLAGIMVWSVDTDDFQGECTDSDDENSQNFPLMRAINKSIGQSLEEIKNSIIKQKLDELENSSFRIVSSADTLLFLGGVLILRHLFLF